MDGWLMHGEMAGWINFMGSIHTVDYDSSMKRREAHIQPALWMDLEPTMLRERSQTQKDTACGTPWIGNVQDRDTHRDRKQILG